MTHCRLCLKVIRNTGIAWVSYPNEVSCETTTGEVTGHLPVEGEIPETVEISSAGIIVRGQL